MVQRSAVSDLQRKSLSTVGNVFGGDAGPAPNGLELPGDYRNWRVLSPSHREDNKSLRVILGNNIAVRSAGRQDRSLAGRDHSR